MHVPGGAPPTECGRIVRDTGDGAATSWLETIVPDVAGYDAWLKLGVNPRTGRALYAYWRRRVAPDALFGRTRLADDEAPLVVRLDHAYDRLSEQVRCALAERGRRPVLWDCRFTAESNGDASRKVGLAALVRTTTMLRANEHAMLVHDPMAPRWVPASVPVIVCVDAPSERARFGMLATACYNGVSMFGVTQRDSALEHAASAFGATLVTALTPPATRPTDPATRPSPHQCLR